MSIPSLSPHSLTYAFPKQRPEYRSALAPGAEAATRSPGEHERKGRERKPESDINELAEGEQDQVKKLKERDAEVRRHEQAHLSQAGRYAISRPRFEYQRGPDGKNYAIGGEVTLDVSEISGDPAATIRKMEQVKRSALAPERPSTKDRSIARQANQAIAKAKAKLQVQSQDVANQGIANPYSLKTTSNIAEPTVSYLA